MIRILCVGKLKERFYAEAVQEYLKRINKYTKINIIECPDFSDKVNCLEKERDELLKFIQERDYIITLEIAGEIIDSVTFSKKLNCLFNNNSTVTFIIGGSNGLHDDIKKRSNWQLSFSKMTFPHQLFRVILLEQIYRSYKINNHETYHK